MGGSKSIPEIGFLEEEISEADNSNTVFIQNHGSAGNNGMHSQVSSGSYGIQNQGSSGSYVMNSDGSSGSIGMQNHGSSSNVGIQNHGSSGSGISGMNYQSVGYY